MLPSAPVVDQLRRGESARSNDSVVTCLFLLGVLSQNTQFLNFGNSEYQPWIYCAVVPYAISVSLATNPRIGINRVLALTLSGIAVLLVLAIAVTQAAQISTKDILRILALPLVAGATWLYLVRVSQATVRFVILLHAGFLLFALAFPGVAKAITEATGGRGSGYYEGWNSYFYSEPSYAALAFLFLAFFASRTGRIPGWEGLVLVILLVSTFSVTGVLGAAAVGATLLWQRSRIAFVTVCIAVPFAFLSLSLIPADSSILVFQRLAMLLDALRSLGGLDAQTIMLALNAVEPSGMWRVVSNLYAISCASEFPFGLGSMDIADPISRSRCSGFLASLLFAAAPNSLLNVGLSAQSVFANLTVFAGLPGAFIGLVLGGMQVYALRNPLVLAAFPLAMLFILFFLFWQSAWGAPTASLMIAAAFMKVRSVSNPDIQRETL